MDVRAIVEIDTYISLVQGSDAEIERVNLPLFWQSFEYEHMLISLVFGNRVTHNRPASMIKYKNLRYREEKITQIKKIQI